jgi:hypothetical protein
MAAVAPAAPPQRRQRPLQTEGRPFLALPQPPGVVGVGLLGPRHPHLLDLGPFPVGVAEGVYVVLVPVGGDDHVQPRRAVFLGGGGEDGAHHVAHLVLPLRERAAVDEQLEVARAVRAGDAHEERVPEAHVVHPHHHLGRHARAHRYTLPWTRARFIRAAMWCRW